MEFEMTDEPQGKTEQDDGARDGGLVEDHIALRNQSSVKPSDYPGDQLKDQSLVQPRQMG